jgi:cytochrome b
MTKLRLPNSFEWLMLWHGLFAGAYTIAWLTAEGAPGLHEFSGYATLALLGVRLIAARIAGGRAPWALPIPKASIWKNFGSKLLSGNLGVLRSRTPFAPLSGLVILSVLVLVTLSGLTADWWEWEDLHEGVAEGSLALVLFHIAIVSLAPLLKRLGESRSEHRAPPQLAASTRAD